MYHYRCSMRQVDMLATTLEPIRHRDYTVAAKHKYPATPLKKLPSDPNAKKKKKKGKRRTGKAISRDVERVKNMADPMRDAVTPHSIIDDTHLFTTHGQKELTDKLVKKQLSTIEQERTREFTNEKDYDNVEGYAECLSARIIEESLPKTITVFEPSELYAQDLASSILQQALDNVNVHMNEKEKSIIRKTENTRLPAGEPDNQKMQVKPVDTVKDGLDDRHVMSRGYSKERSLVREYDRPTPDLSILDKYKK